MHRLLLPCNQFLFVCFEHMSLIDRLANLPIQEKAIFFKFMTGSSTRDQLFGTGLKKVFDSMNGLMKGKPYDAGLLMHIWDIIVHF